MAVRPGTGANNVQACAMIPSQQAGPVSQPQANLAPTLGSMILVETRFTTSFYNFIKRKFILFLWSFLFSITSRLTLGSTQFPIQLVPVSLPKEVKQLGHEAEHSPPSIAEVKKNGAITPLSHTSSWRGADLIKQGNRFIF
jgi:hypothetical protein